MSSFKIDYSDAPLPRFMTEHAELTAVGNGFVQWKGTDVCLDFTCLCNTHLHFDGDFAYAIRCWHCQRVWELPAYIPLTLVDEDTAPHTIQDTEPHGELDKAGEEAFEPYDPQVTRVDTRRPT